MAEKIIYIDIDADGSEFKMELEGFKGKGCKDIAKQFEKLGKVKLDETKPEFYEAETKSTVKVGQ